MKNKRHKHKPYLRLKGVLAEKGQKQKDIALLLNLSPVTINHKINGTLEFTLSEAEKVCRYLGVGLDIFFTSKVT